MKIVFWVRFWARLKIISTVSLKHILEVHWCLYFGVEKGKIYWQTSAYYKNNPPASMQAAFALVLKRLHWCLTWLHHSGGTRRFYFSDCSVSHAAFWLDPKLFLQLPFEHDQSFLFLSKENNCARPSSSSESTFILPMQATDSKAYRETTLNTES